MYRTIKLILTKFIKLEKMIMKWIYCDIPKNKINCNNYLITLTTFYRENKSMK